MDVFGNVVGRLVSNQNKKFGLCGLADRKKFISWQ